MKIKIKSEPFINNPAPKLTKEMFDWFWTTFWSLRLECYVPCIETIDIRINSALYYSPVHFYITINGVYEFHKSWDRVFYGRDDMFLIPYTRTKVLFDIIDRCAEERFRTIQEIKLKNELPK